MLTNDRLIAFVVTATVIAVTPGPNVLFILSRSILHGRRSGLATVVGNSAGIYLQVAAVAIGLGEVVKRSVAVFTALKLLGAVYLAWLGVQAYRHRHELSNSLDRSVPAKSNLQILREGLLVGFANPKSIIFLAAILPQFADVASGRIPLQILLLGLIFTAIATVFNVVLAFSAGALNDWFTRSPRRLDAVGGAGGLAMVGIGVHLALTRQKD